MLWVTPDTWKERVLKETESGDSKHEDIHGALCVFAQVVVDETRRKLA